jgi:hypothetical protein
MALTTTSSSWSPPPYRPDLFTPPPPYRPPLSPPTQTLVASPALSRRFDEGEINQIVRKCLFDNEIKNVELDTCDPHSECSICFELCETNGGKIKCCHNTYHKECIMKWVKAGNNTCPTCRGIIR